MKSFGKAEILQHFDPAAPIPEPSLDLLVTEAERVVLLKKKEYSRKNQLKKSVMVTHQQWIEDFLTRGFTRLEHMRHGRSLERVRVHNDSAGAFYDVQSRIEINYLYRRHAALHGKTPVVTPTPAMSPDVAFTEPVVKAVATEAKAPVEAATDNDAVDPVSEAAPAPQAETAPASRPGDFFSPATAVVGASDPADTADRLAELVVTQVVGGEVVGRIYAGLEDEAVRPLLWANLFGSDREFPESDADLVTALRGLFGETAWSEYLAIRRERRSDATAKAERVDLPRFAYARGESIAPQTRVARITANLEAIRLLKTLEAEERPATQAEIGVLGKYAGWGADKEVMNRQMRGAVVQYREAHGAEESQWLAWVTKQVENTKRLYPNSPQSRFAEAEGEFLSWWKTYGKYAEEIWELLTPEEFDAAERSVLNAHYTEEGVCHSLWDIAVRAGFRGGRVLEPAVGVGRILAAMPKELRDQSRLDAVELDSLSARIAAKLMPDAKVQQSPFEESATPTGAYDLVITNVPFSKTGPGVQEGLDSDVSFNLHNYFIAESMQKLRPGGLAVFITSSSTLDNNPDQRLALSRMAELWGAIRLPSDAFAGSANTEVVTDILLMRKPGLSMAPGALSFIGLGKVALPTPFAVKTPSGNPVMIYTEVATGKVAKKVSTYDIERGLYVGAQKTIDEATVNQVFAEHPEMCLGEPSLDGRMYGGTDLENGQYTVLTPKGAASLDERLSATIALLPENIPNPSLERYNMRSSGSLIEDEVVIEAGADEDLIAPFGTEPGSVVAIQGGRRGFGIVARGNRMITPLALAPAQVEAVRLYIGVRDALKGQIAIDKTEPEPSARSDAHRQVLKDAYDAAVLNGGSFTQLLKRIATIIPHEPWIGTVNGLEDVREEPAEKAGAKPVRTYHPAKILTNRTIFASALPSRAENLPDAVNQSRASLGRIDCAYVAGQLGKDGASPDVIEGISAAICDAGLGFRDPGDLNTIIPADIYRSGALAKKLARAKRAAEVDARFQSNVSALENAMPAPATWSSIRAPLGAQFVPPLLYARFLADEFDLVVRDKDMPKFVLYEPARGCWHIREEYITASHRASRYSSEEITVEKVVDHAFAQTEPLVKVDGALDMAETDVARNLVSQLGAAWTRYVEANADVREEIVMAYNERFTSFVPLKPDTTYMQFPGLSPHFKPRSHQISAIAKLLPEPNGVVAYNVGFGKTAIGIILAAESRRIGAAKKPLIVCDGANYMQFVQAMRELYPAFRLLVADDANFSPSERERFKASMAFGDYDCILVSRTQFERIPVSASMKSDWIQRELAELRAQSASMGGSANKRAAKDQAKAIEALDAELTRLMHERTEDRGMTWDQLGVDLLVVDESHRHKKIGIKTVHDRIKGIDTGRSNRGYDLLIKARYIQERRNGNGVIGLTGTPCTNTMAEFHTSILIFAPNVCKELGIEHFDAFKSMFCQVRDELVMNESSGKWKMEQHLSKFVNGPAFIRFVRLGMLVEMDSSKLKLNIPEHVNGNIEHEVVPLNEQTLSVMERLGALYSTYENLAGDEKKEMCWVPLVLMQMGMVASIDPRMLNPTLPVAPDGLLSRVVQNTAGIYADPELAGKAQVIFLDRYGEMDTSKLDALEKGGMKPSGKLVLDESNDSEDSDDEEAPEKLESKKPRLNLYYEIRDMLIARGIKPGDIACVCDVAKKDRAALFAKVNSGAIRIVIGSSDKLGIGANFQKNLYAAHHVDPARNMTPDQMEQRNGRILRDGNTNKKVRVIYYGMEDTCCPAIFGRIQRKSDFIRQGYAEQGVGAEFEDVSSVRLEELKAALIPDKRAMQLAELKSELADALRLVDSGKLRHRQIANDLSNATSALDYLKGVGGQRASKREAWFAANTTPIADPQTTSELELDVVVDLTSLYFGTPELKKWYEENGPELRGPAKAVVKALDTLSALQTDVSIPSSELKRDLGTIKINGLPIRLSREQVSFISGRESTELVAKVSDPVVAGADIIQPNRYRTGTMMLKVGRLAAFEAKNDAVTIASRISDMERRKAGFLEDLAANPMPSELGVSEIRAKVKAVEKNMAETPYVRGSKLRQARSAVIAGMNAVSGVVEEVIQATIPPVQLRA